MLRRPHNIISYLKMNALPDESQKLLRDKVDQVRAESLASDIAEREVAGTLISTLVCGWLQMLCGGGWNNGRSSIGSAETNPPELLNLARCHCLGREAGCKST